MLTTPLCLHTYFRVCKTAFEQKVIEWITETSHHVMIAQERKVSLNSNSVLQYSIDFMFVMPFQHTCKYNYVPYSYKFSNLAYS